MTIGILAALDRELEALTAEQERFAERGYVLRQCGVGKVNAALAAYDLVVRGGARRVIVIGTCASLQPTLRQGRMMLASEARYHDVDASALGFSPGQIPYHGTCIWHADPELTHALNRALNEVGDSPWTGCILTGDRFVASRRETSRLRETYAGSALDMETAAVAHACDQLGVGWASLRVVSDNADEDAALDFETLIHTASQRLARVILEIRAQDLITVPRVHASAL